MPQAHFRLSSYRGMGFEKSIGYKSCPVKYAEKQSQLPGDEITYPTKKENCL